MNAFCIHAGMSAERSFSNSDGPRAVAIVVTVSAVTLFLPRYHGAESAAPVASPANCSRRRFEVWIILTATPATRIVRLDALVWNTGAVGTWGAEPEAPRGFRAMDLNRLAIAARDDLDHLVDVGKDGSDEPAGPRTNEDAVGETLVLALADEARKRPADGAARAELAEAGSGEGLASHKLANGGSNGFGGRLARLLAVRKYRDGLDKSQAADSDPESEFSGAHQDGKGASSLPRSDGSNDRLARRGT